MRRFLRLMGILVAILEWAKFLDPFITLETSQPIFMNGYNHY